MNLHKTQCPDDDLEEAKRVLSCLEQLTLFYSVENANPPDEEFWFGYSTILGYVYFNVVNAIEKLSKNEQKQKTQHTGIGIDTENET